ncbi:Predicted arabinose efflux permease, MFS family [Rhizobium sp. NFR07]|nr:Predicted arabinose efflux permease, MFS family [Rhizobium sp. NFR07]
MDRISRLPLEEAEKLVGSIRAKGARLAVPGVVDISDITDNIDGIGKIVLQSVQDMLLKLALQMAHDDFTDRRERQAQGIQLAKARGKYAGRRADHDKNRLIIELRLREHSIARTAKIAGCSESHVKRPRGAAIATSIAFLILILLLIGMTSDTRVWLVLRFLLGCGANAVYVLSEASLLSVAPPAYRGRLMGAYTSITTLGYAVGPLILRLAGSADFTPFLVTAALLFLAIIPFLFVRVRVKRIEESENKAASIPAFLTTGGLLVFAYGSTTLFDNGFMSLLPSYGLRSGWTEADVTILLFTLMLGGTIFQIPIGWAIDRSSPFAIILLCALTGMLAFVLFSIVLDQNLLLVVAFLLGGAVLGVQTVTLAELGSRYSGSLLVAGNASLSLTWGISSLFGALPVDAHRRRRSPVAIGSVSTANCIDIKLTSWRPSPFWFSTDASLKKPCFFSS